MSTIIKLFVACFISAFISITLYSYLQPKEVVPDYQSLVDKIDSLNIELDILKLQKDSLHAVIDSSKVKVKVIEHWYEKELTDITNQSIADDVVFFTEYLSETNK